MTTATAAALHPAQRRILAVLVTAQIFSGAGLAAGVTVGALLAQDMLGATDLSGLPAATGSVVLLFVALFVYGAGTATILQARYSGADLATPGTALARSAPCWSPPPSAPSSAPTWSPH